MSNYGEYMKEQAQKADDRFFGEGNKKMRSNKYFEFKHFIDNDHIMIVTRNVRIVKDSLVLVIDNDKVVYLKEWNVMKVHSWDEGFNADIVKLDRKYFKSYTFRTPFDGMAFDEADTFDSLVELAKAQDEKNLKVAKGHI